MSKPAKLFILLAAFSSVFCLMMSDKTSALSSVFPDPAITRRVSGCDAGSPPCPSTWPVSATVSRAGYNSLQNFTQQLEAPISVTKLYFRQPTGNSAVIESMCHELQDSPGTIADFYIRQTDGDENISGAQYFSSSSDLNNCVNGEHFVGNIGTPGAPLNESTVPGRAGYYVATLYVAHRVGSQPGTHSYRVRTNGAGTYATFAELPPNFRGNSLNPNDYGLANASAMLDKYGAAGSKSTFALDFAADCAISGETETMFMKWFDADYPGAGNNNLNTRFDVYDMTAGGQLVASVTGTSSWTIDGNQTVTRSGGVEVPVPDGNNPLGNNGDYRALGFTVTRNHSYRWEWTNVDRNNGIQIWMPYSEINTSLNCAPQNGNVKVTKYSPPSHAANGIVSDVDPLVNSAPMSITNSSNVTFGNYSSNPWDINNLFGNNTYRIRVDVPPGGWELAETRTNGTVIGVTCSQPNNTGTCEVSVYLGWNGGTIFVDFWFKPPLDICESGFFGANLSPNPVDPNQIEITQNFRLEIGAQFTGPVTGPVTGTLNIVDRNNGTNIIVNNVPVTYTELPGLNKYMYNRDPVIFTAIGEYSIVWVVNWAGGPAGGVRCERTAIANKKPYVKVYGHDVLAGGSFVDENGVCANPQNPRASIFALARAHDPTARNDPAKTDHFSGSSSQFAVFALGAIDQLFSLGLHSPRNAAIAPSLLTDLTFGNYTAGIGQPVDNLTTKYDDTKKDYIPGNTAINYYGYGSNSGLKHCAPNYFSKGEAGNQTFTSTTTAANVNGVQRLKPVSAGQKVDIPGMVLPNAGSRTIFVDGDAVITGNITFPAFTSVANIPSFYLVVRGNIYIDNDVTRLDGVFVAQPQYDSNGNMVDKSGTIYTCTDGGNLYNINTLSPNCSGDLVGGSENKQLLINGSFIAQRVKFLRTSNTRRQSTPNERALFNNGNLATRAAEIFNFSPEAYLSPNIDDVLKKSSPRAKYDYISSLPPIL